MNEHGPQLSDTITGALEALFLDDERWRAISVPGCATVARSWPDGTVDTLILLNPDTACAVREDPRGRQLWSMDGTPHQIVDQARKLAGPDSPDAPTALGSGPPRAERR